MTSFGTLADGTPFPFWDDRTHYARTYVVARHHLHAADDNPGTTDAPFATIGRAVEVLNPGEKVIVHAGIYRECVRPLRGGDAFDKIKLALASRFTEIADQLERNFFDRLAQAGQSPGLEVLAYKASVGPVLGWIHARECARLGDFFASGRGLEPGPIGKQLGLAGDPADVVVARDGPIGDPRVGYHVCDRRLPAERCPSFVGITVFPVAKRIEQCLWRFHFLSRSSCLLQIAERLQTD